MKVHKGTGIILGALIIAVALIIATIALLNVGSIKVEQTSQIETGKLSPLTIQLANVPVTLNALDLGNDISILVQNRYSKPVKVVRVWLLEEDNKPIKILDASQLFKNQIIQPGNLCFNITEKPSDKVKYVYIELAKIGIKKTIVQPLPSPPTTSPPVPSIASLPVYTSLIGIAKQVTFHNLNKITVQSYEDYETLKFYVENMVDEILDDIPFKDTIVTWLTDSLWNKIFDDKEYIFDELDIDFNEDLPELIKAILDYIIINSNTRDINETLRDIRLTEPILLLKVSGSLTILDEDSLLSGIVVVSYNTTLNVDIALAIVKDNDVFRVIRMIENAEVENFTISITINTWPEPYLITESITGFTLKDCDNWIFIPHADKVQINGFVGAFKEDENSDYRIVIANYITLSKADTELLNVPLLTYVKVSDNNHLIALRDCKNYLSYQLICGGSKLAYMYILNESDTISKVNVTAEYILTAEASKPLTEATITNVKGIFGRKSILIITTQDNKVYLVENLETLTIYVNGEYEVIEVKETKGQVQLPGILQDIAELLGLQGITINSYTSTAPIQINANNIETLIIHVENGKGGTITYTIAQP